MLIDSKHRELATDPTQSFIVQAPAGSGKTEILTQRFLRLLSIVRMPEQIVALTFTRKAAHEMRERIVMALQKAANRHVATSSHEQRTMDLACDALLQDKRLNWQLLQQPGRLRIITIDSLCQTLVRAIPLQEKQLPYAGICDKPQRHYNAAARACFAFCIEQKDYHQPLKTLLQHLDNRQDQLLTLFCELLSTRDQWLHLLYQAKAQNKETVEQALSWMLQHEVQRLLHSIPDHHMDELMNLSRRLALIENNPESPRYPLCCWDEVSALDSHLAERLASLLLTSQNTLRKAFDHHIGLKRGACPDVDYNELKAASKDLLSALNEWPDFLTALIRVKKCPQPAYDHSQWNVLQALFTILPLLAAHLQLAFAEHNEVDFSAIAEQALQALGDDENPTDLALYLDNTIHHLLVDEFQDTSMQQFHLLSQLVQGWQPQDGNTLFVVGDPMQSIYRFRAAEVGLFLRAKQDGIGPMRLTPLALSCNFRSTALLVDWVNDQFKSIFPAKDDMESGAITFHPSVNVKPSMDESYVMAFQYENRRQEAKALVDLIAADLRDHPSDNLAILVRSRRQLIDIIPCLREQNIPFQGVDIALLSSLPHLRDVWSLTQALLQPANRLVWLAFLRSPWCGLSLSDLHLIATYSKHQSIYFALSKIELMPDLSEEGRLRAGFIYTVLHDALARRHQQSLVDGLTQTLQQLHLDYVLSPTEQDDLEQYWQLLDRFETKGQLEDMAQFNIEFNTLYSQQVTPSRLHIMTIHKSKGLEFDGVIIPSLSTRPPRMDTPLIRWLKVPSQEHDELLLLSPMKAADSDPCLLYDYLGQLDAEKNKYEMHRLLYVAVTRAKKRLYLFDNSDKASQGTFRQALQQQVFHVTAPDDSVLTDNINPHLALYHLPIAHYQQPPTRLIHDPNNTPLITINHTPRLIGIVAHELLQWICDHHPTHLNEVPWAIAANQLKTMGFQDEEHVKATHLLKKQLTDFFTHPIGQWIIKKHEEEQNEYELLVHVNDMLTTNIIDRTFCENGVRWIIDFKTGHEDGTIKHDHRKQVNHYATLFEQHHTNQPIHCGLYYLESHQWITWEYR